MKQLIKWFVLLCACIFFSYGCNQREKEEALQKREAALNQKEQELILKEKTLELKEQEVIRREQAIDSTSKIDTTTFYNPALTGTWITTMTCTETTCTGSAIGDKKTEQWIFSYEANNIIVKAMAGDNLIRVYTGAYNGNTIELTGNTREPALPQTAKMVVRLQSVKETTMEGEREIVRDDNCKVIYSLQMEKQ